jgi:hypothetical protein
VGSALGRAPGWKRRRLATVAALGASSVFAPALLQTQAPVKVAGIHASPVEYGWNSVLHAALVAADKEGVIDHTFSERVAGTGAPRAMREHAETGSVLIALTVMARRARVPHALVRAYRRGERSGQRPDGLSFGLSLRRPATLNRSAVP